MEAGSLRKRITIQKKSVARNSYGEEVITWVTHCQAWAQMEPLSGREFLEARQIQAEAMVRITLRYQAGIEPEMRVLFGTRTFNIQAVVHVEERGREIQLMTVEQL
jgi:SPP1 family predicted phage head-tail adaptor